jgi:stress-induced morphogen
MSIDLLRGKSDETIDAIKAALAKYEGEHQGAQISLYRQNSVSVRVRIIDPSFDGKSKPERNDLVWKYLADLSDDEQSDISMLLLLTPSETKQSFANFEFEDPVPSKL